MSAAFTTLFGSVELRISKSHKVKLSWTEPMKEDIDPILCLSAKNGVEFSFH